MNDNDSFPQPGEHLYELGEPLTKAVKRKLGIPIGESTLEYAYRSGTATQLGRIHLGAWKAGRSVVTSVEAVRRWSIACAKAQAASAPVLQHYETEQSKPRRQRRMTEGGKR
jgi:hypothetical protein